MADFSKFFLMKPDDVRAYTVEVLQFFRPDDEISVQEIGDGNINYVTRAWTEKDGRSVIVKQADKLLRSSGRPLDIRRNRIEAEILGIEKELAPDFIPEIYHYDEIMAAVSMEDISAYGNLRKELAADRVYDHLAENLSTFLAEVLLPTTDLVLDRREKKERVKFFANPELCEITEDLVLTEPYWDYKGRNVITAGLEGFVREYLYEDRALHAEVGKLRDGFMNHAQCLLHGDLHSGSIFANADGIKIIDPEFAFYGPMGYDIGNVIGNLFFALANKEYLTPEKKDVIGALKRTIADVCDLTKLKVSRKYDERVTFPLYRTEEFKRSWLDGVRADSIGYAGTEIIRRVVGDSKVPEVSSMPVGPAKLAMEKALITLGIRLIKERETIRTGREVLEAFPENPAV